MAYYVSSGEVSSGVFLSNNSMFVYSGGLASATMVGFSGVLFVSSGGRAEDTTVNSGGVVRVSSGGAMSGGTVNSGGAAYVTGGVVEGVEVTGSGSMGVYSNGVARNVIAGGNVFNSGTMGIHNLGRADGVTVNSKGFMRINSGGAAWNVVVNSGGSVRINSGGAASAMILSQGGAAEVVAGGNVEEVRVERNGALYLSGGAASGISAYSGASVAVFANGRADDLTFSGGNLSVHQRGSAVGAEINSGAALWIELHSQTLFNGVFYGEELEISGARLSGLDVCANLQIVLPSGTLLTSASVDGGSVEAYSGGVVESTTVEGDGRVLVSTGGSAIGLEVGNSGSVYVSGGVASSTVINSGGKMYVNSYGQAGSADGATVNIGGLLTVSRNCVVTGVFENGGRVVGVNGATISYASHTFSALEITASATVHSNTTAKANKVVGGGAMELYYGGSGVGNVVSGGNVTVYSGGVLNSTTMKIGNVRVSGGGSASCTVLERDGHLVIASGGAAWDTVVEGSITIYGLADNVVVSSGGVVYVVSGASATGIVENGGHVNVGSGAYAEFLPSVISGVITGKTTMHSATSAAALVVNGGNLYLYDLASAGKVRVNAGELYVAGGATVETIVENGGVVTLEEGANVHFAANTISGSMTGNATVHSNTVAKDIVTNDRNLYIYSGGVASGLTILNSRSLSNGVTVYSGGLVVGAEVASRACLFISGGVVSNITAQTSGTVYVYSGGTATDVAFNSSGILVVSADGAASGVNLGSGGSAWIYGNLSDVQVAGGGRMMICEGGVVEALTLEASGALSMYAGGSANFAAASGATVYIRLAPGTTVSGAFGEELINIQDGVMSASVIGDGVTVNVMRNGLVSETFVNPGGKLEVNAGAAVDVMENGGYVYSRAGDEITFASNTFRNVTLEDQSATVHSNTTAVQTVLNYFGIMTVYSGGVASATTVNAGGSLWLSSGCSANGAKVNSYGSLLIYSGATAVNVAENGGWVNVAEGASATFVANTFGGFVLGVSATVHSGTTASGLTVSSTKLVIFDGGSATEVTVVGSSGSISLASGGVVDFATVNSGAEFNVSGGTANGVRINSDGRLEVSAAGRLSGATLNEHGTAYILGGCYADNTVINGGTMYVYSSAHVNSVTINNGSLVASETVSNLTMYGGAVSANVDTAEINGGVLGVGWLVLASAVAVNPGGGMVVQIGGRAVDVVENGGWVDDSRAFQITYASNTFSGTTTGSATVHSNTTALNVAVASGGTIHVYASGVADNLSVNSGGSAVLHSGAIISGVGVSSGGKLVASHGVDASGVAADFGGVLEFCVTSGAELSLTGTSGGGVFDVRLSDGGSGAVAEKNWIFSFASGASATQVRENGGAVYVAEGASVTFAANSFGNIELENDVTVHQGTVADQVTVNSGAVLSVYSGGSATQLRENGGCVYIEEGGSVTFAAHTFSGAVWRNALATIHSGTTAVDTTVDSQGRVHVSEGGVVSGITVNPGAYLYISGGAEALEVTENGGAVWLSGSANVSYTPHTFGGITLSDFCVATVHSGTVALDNVVSGAYSHMYVFDGGIASNTTVLGDGFPDHQGGTITVSSGGIAVDTVVEMTGLVNVHSGGVVSGTRLKSGTVAVYEGGSANGTIADGGQLELHGTASALTANSGATINVYSGATAVEIVENGGVVNLYEGANATFAAHVCSGMLVACGTSATVHSGTVAEAAVVEEYAQLHIYSGGVANGVIIAGSAILFNDNARLYVHDGGALNDTYLSNTIVYLYGDGSVNRTTIGNATVVFSGGVANSVTIEKGGRISAYSGAVLNSLTIYSGSAVCSDCRVNALSLAGGSMTLSGGVASNAALNSGRLDVYSGGSAAEIYIAGGYLTLREGGTAENVVVSGGEVKTMGGSATAVTILDGRGHVSGGEISNVTMRGGHIFVTSGGTLADSIIYGGDVSLYSGTLSGTTKLIGGTLTARYDSYSVVHGAIQLSLRGNCAGSAIISGYRYIPGYELLIDGDDSDSGEFLLASDWRDASATVNVLHNGETVAVTVGETTTVGDLTYTFTSRNSDLRVSVYGKYTTAAGRVETGGNSVLTLANARVRSLIAGAAQDVDGDVIMNLALDAASSSPCNIYGGGNGVDVVGSVNVSITAGAYTGMIYGGSRAASGEVSVGDTSISVSGITHSDNPKLLASGNSAWLLGGGAAVSGGSAASGNVNISISGATLGQVVGGAQAQDAGSVASVASVNISLQNCSISGDLFGGGYAYNGATSEVTGDVHITLYADEANFLYSYGAIFGGGANPSHPQFGGWSLVRGNSTITLTGDGDFYNLVELNGDGKIGGTVYGVKTLEFKDFTNEFAASAKNFDVIKFSGETRMETAAPLRAETLAFDLTGRTSEDDAFAEGISFVLNQARTLEIELGDATGDLALLAINENDLAGATVNLYRNAALLATFTYGEEFDEYKLSCNEGILTLKS